LASTLPPTGGLRAAAPALTLACALAGALVLSGCASAPPVRTAAATAPATASSAAPEQVCSMEAPTGTRFIRTRCVTVQDRNQRTEADKEWAEKATNDRPLGVPTR
jgi:ABC-type uncharacterized transport system auxiliary subunit